MSDPYGNDAMSCAQGAVIALQEGHPALDCAEPSEGFADHLVRTVRIRDGCSESTARDIARWAFEWVTHGMPQVVVAGSRAGSFSATRIPREFCSQVRAPWRVFLVKMPAGVIGNHEQSILCESVRISAPEVGEGLRTLYLDIDVTTGPAPASNQVICAPWTEYADPRISEEFDVPELRRSAETVMKFLFSVVAKLQGDASFSRAIAGTPTRPRLKRRSPRCWTIEMKKPAQHDVRRGVYEYVRGNGKPMRVQGIVAGHWKNQPCGVGRSERRFIHIEPYWRGPEDARIVVTPRVVDCDPDDDPKKKPN